ncbi:MAG TPA: AAA family ATPase, partial [Holophagaceae bacterium]
SLEAQTWIFLTQMAEEIRSASQHDVVVCDRSVLDNYAYLMFGFGRQKAIERYMQHWMKSYDLLFKVPFLGDVAADGVRDTDTFFAESIDRLVDELLAERNLPHERLDPGDRSTWIHRVKQVVLNHPKGQKRLLQGG